MAPLFRVKFTEAFIMPICFNNCFSMAETQDEQVIPVICDEHHINYSNLAYLKSKGNFSRNYKTVVMARMRTERAKLKVEEQNSIRNY